MNAVEDLEKEKRLRQWAQVEQENAAKERIHYRDVLFNEVREHGQVRKAAAASVFLWAWPLIQTEIQSKFSFKFCIKGNPCQTKMGSR